MNKCLNILLITVQAFTLICGFSFLIAAYVIINQNHKDEKIFYAIIDYRNITFAALSAISLVIYGTIFYNLKVQLKLTYPSFYQRNRKNLLTLFYSITISLIMKTVFLILLTIPFYFKYISKTIDTNKPAYIILLSLNFLCPYFLP